MGLSPSEVGDYLCYCLDEAVAYLGTKIESELDQVKGKTDEEIRRGRQGVLDKYLGTRKPRKGAFADPALFFKAQSGG